MKTDVSACVRADRDGEVDKEDLANLLDTVPADAVVRVEWTEVEFVEDGVADTVQRQQVCARWTEDR